VREAARQRAELHEEFARRLGGLRQRVFRAQIVNIPDALKVTVLFPPLGVNGNPVTEVSM
jgi:hypothetical protein